MKDVLRWRKTEGRHCQQSDSNSNPIGCSWAEGNTLEGSRGHCCDRGVLCGSLHQTSPSEVPSSTRVESENCGISEDLLICVPLT